MIYLDGSALCRFLPGVRHYEAFGVWARDHVDELVTTQLGFTELRQAAELYPRSAAEQVAGIVDLVRAGVAVIRFSDDNVAISSHATSVLKPFAALHVGAAVAHVDVDTIVTYDPALANVARIYELAVVSPGLPDGWYSEYEGPPEHWKPVALDAPYDPGAEFDLPEAARRPDAYEVALEEARREEAARASLEQAAADAASGDEGGDVEAAPEPGHEAEEVSDLERALRDAEAAALAEAGDRDGELDELPDDEGDAPGDEGTPARGSASAEPGKVAATAAQARTGTYRPRIEAWHEGDPEEDRPRMEGEGEAEVEASGDGDGLPWSGRPVLTLSSPEPDVLPHEPLVRTPPPETPAAHTPVAQTPPALAPPAPIEPAGIPNLPREERGVPPVAAPPRESIGSAVRRPMFETNPTIDSRASRPPEPVPPVPPEESSPLTVPIKWNVELDEPEAYLPLRFASDTARVLPSLPVSFAGGQGGLTIESAGTVSVPALEPTGPAYPAANPDDVRSPVATPGRRAPMSARERKAAEKAAEKDRERREKAARKAKGATPAPAPVPAPPASPSAAPPVSPAVAPPASPSAAPPASAPPAGSEGWKLDDVLGFGPKKQGS